MRRKGLPSFCEGFAIILVLATLVLLALLSITYIKLALIDRNIARNYMDNKRAKLIAQSGVDYAIGRLNQIIQQGWFTNGKLTDKEWVYDYESKDPSFVYPAAIPVNGKSTKFSSVMDSSTYGRNSDLFSLKVIDTQSQININDGAKLGSAHQVSINLARILNELGEIVSIDQSKLKDPAKGLGENIIYNRSAQGYTSKDELLRIVNGDKREFLKFEGFVTTHSWSNDRVAVPVPLADNDQVKGVYEAIMPGLFDSYIRPFDTSKYYDINGNVIQDNTGKKIYRYGHNRNYKGNVIDNNDLYFYDGRATQEYYEPKFYNAVFSYDALNPQWIELTSRSPVNINTASREVLLSLITGLEGWFVGPRRAPNPRSVTSSFYQTMPQKYTYDKTAWDRESFGAFADEIGFIYRTIPYKKSGAGTEFIDYIDAQKIVDEIIHCRKRLTSAYIAGLDYNQVGFGGPFKSWAQFNSFVNTLLQSDQLIKDNRSIYKDLVSNGGGLFTLNPPVYTDPPPVNVVDSSVQRRIASQSVADCLKANFNPNLHLNELNPDHNLYLLVDKTDLIVNSIEFCFTPMGYFEIESQGYVLKPDTDDALTATDNKVIAHQSINAIVRLYNALYHTTQRDFYGYTANYSQFPVTISLTTAEKTTNNNYALETGPEVDNGTRPIATEYDGYIRLSTNLGCYSGAGHKSKQLKVLTPAGGIEYSSDIHSHFQLDHLAHYHASGGNSRLPIGSNLRYTASWYNFPDKTEKNRGPYFPFNEPASPNKSRLCNTYKLNTLTPPNLSKYAPEDLMIDGVYTEPHSAFGYDQISFTSSAAISLWIKPNWYPEVTNRIKTFLTMRAYFPIVDNDYLVEWPLPFDILYYPVNGAVIEAFPNRAILFSYLSGQRNIVGGLTEHFAGRGWSSILNHEFENGAENFNRFIGQCNRFNQLRSHEWMHITVSFSEVVIGTMFHPKIETYINGVKVGDYNYNNSSPQGYTGLQTGTIRIGGDYSSYCAQDEVASVDSASNKGYMNRIFYSDCTLDEFFFWADQGNSAVDNSINIWEAGRYYKPDDSSASDAVFTSIAVNLTSQDQRPPSEATIDLPPVSEAGEASFINSTAQIKIVGLSWTYYAENYVPSAEFPVPPNSQGQYSDGTPRLKPVMLDWQSPENPAVLTLYDGSDTLCILYLRKGGTDNGPYIDEGYSAVDLTLEPAENFYYKIKFRIGNADLLNTVLLASPVFDDITIYYTQGTQFVSYHAE